MGGLDYYPSKFRHQDEKEEKINNKTNNNKMKILELFSGTGSVGKVARAQGHTVISLDLKGADINTDIMLWDYKKAYEPNHFDMIWASPPCNTFSNLRRSWIGRKTKYFGDEVITKEMLDEDMINVGLPILRKTLEIIQYFDPIFYVIENPMTGRMKDYINDIPYTQADYCQYGFDYKKPTLFWNNFDFQGKRCNCSRKHVSTLGHANDRTNLSQRYRIPPDLIEDVFQAMYDF